VCSFSFRESEERSFASEADEKKNIASWIPSFFYTVKLTKPLNRKKKKRERLTKPGSASELK